MEHKGRPWQLYHNYLHDNQTYMRIRKKKEKEEEKVKDREKKNT